MSPQRVLAAVGQIVRLFSWTTLAPIPFALLYEAGDVPIGPVRVPHNVLVFLASFAIAFTVWFIIHVLTRKTHVEELQEREAYLTVGVGWIVLALLASVPFLLSKVILDPVDAFFEAMAGLTTTGSTILSTDLDTVPRSVMLWRALLQYIGGMGIIVLGIALLSRLSSGGMQLLQAEAPGPTVARIQPKLAHTAKVLWVVYAGISFVIFAVLLGALLGEGLTFADAIYDAIIHTLTSISTGGFSNHSASAAHWDSVWIEGILIIAMLIAGTNFTHHYHTSRGDWRKMFRDQEWRYYILGFVVVTLAVTGILWQAGQAVGEALRGAAFTVASLITSTGYGTADFDQWPDGARFILLVLMFIGGSAGSTAGGMKVVRILLLMKVVRRAFQKLLHPRAVIPLRLGKQPLKDETVWSVIAFFFTYVTLWMAGALILAVTDPVLGMVDASSAAASAIGNMGPGLGVVGPTQGYWDLLPTSKIVLSGLMWAGRLELFAALLVFNRQAWKH